MPPRFLQLADVAELLNISSAQAYALVRSGDLPAIKIGGRGQWRVENRELDQWIQAQYRKTRAGDEDALDREDVSDRDADRDIRVQASRRQN